MARVRTFIAVDLSKGTKGKVKALQEEFALKAPGVKWVTPDNFHLTLLFLGEVEKKEVVAICRTVQKRARKHSAFGLDVEGLGAFPNLRRPKILWAGVTEGIEELKALHDDIEEALLELNQYRREDRAYTPHLTLGRLSAEDRAEDWEPILAAHESWRGGSSTINEVLIMSSDMKRDGPEYSIIGRAALK